MSVTGEQAADVRVPLRDQVREELQARIADGRLRPGDRIFEQDLAAELGISRVPVREAIRMLQSEGFVDVLPRRRGVFVRGLDRQQAKDLFEVREALEVYAARLAAERAEPAEVAQLADLARRAREAHEAGDVDTMSSSNASFHDKLVSLAGNDLMASILEPLHGRLAWLFRMNLEPERVCTEHEQLQSAIAAGDADRAAAVAQQHVLSSQRMVLERMLP
ncbi:GntR family transcriptional regulator [Saccharopolyspora sp. ASAGF58]|uniref:GntR family transcriptional regulator n=1 Tax=Saccharopolyspora sp. ASAGF58 TaxID=2719023 RepID=UPI00143FBCD6|nr:GntR family transcriptional regulator [Saccharopolyspora sp. ASAGF58]QIZ39022.1 GntR family transcriptional regulator [Saccharopolyspora sp. ASAGF58]